MASVQNPILYLPKKKKKKNVFRRFGVKELRVEKHFSQTKALALSSNAPRKGKTHRQKNDRKNRYDHTTYGGEGEGGGDCLFFLKVGV